ncbi:HAD family hydrolase [Nocardiopsis coralliicola]
MARPDAVMWDMDGTLVDTEPLWHVALAEAAGRLGGSLPAEVAQAMTGTDDRTTMRMLNEHTGAGLTGAELGELHAAIVARVTVLLQDGPPLHDGALDTLRGLQKAGIPQALVTSSPRSVAELALETIGRDLFAAVVTADDTDLRKPDPAPYLMGAAALAADPALCWAVEDSASGAAAAQAAGCRVHLAPSAVPTAHAPGRIALSSLTDLLVEATA